MTEPLFTADADPIELGLVELRGVHRYPFSDEIDRPLVRRLVNEFPTVDVPREIAVVGYDDVVYSNTTIVPLTSSPGTSDSPGGGA